MNQKPKPTMKRNDQKRTGTLGIVLFGGLFNLCRRCVFDIRADALEQQRIAEIADMGIEAVAKAGVMGALPDRQQCFIGDKAVRDSLARHGNEFARFPARAC